MTWGLDAGLFFAVFFATIGATKVVLIQLQRRSLLDLPNDRSSHSVPTPRGGGLAVLFVFLTTLMLLAAFGDVPKSQATWLFALTLALGALSWADDLRGLNPFLRLGGHFAAVTMAMALGLIDGPVFGGLLPPLLDKIATAFLWVWFINLFNFMDGIDGIAGVETASVGIGITTLAALSGFGEGLHYIALGLTAAAIGFLVWNWHPAKIFLGDVGSVPIGFLLGWMLLSIAAKGYWAAALILPGYFLADATITLLRRALRGDKIWRAHREHFYQYAVLHGKSHAAVSSTIAAANVMLIALALTVTPGQELWAIFGAVCVITFLILWMLRAARSAPAEGSEE